MAQFSRGEGLTILVLLGTQPQPFTRLIEQVMVVLQREASNIQAVHVQFGNTPFSYDAAYLKAQAFYQHDEYLQLIEQSQVIVTHGGAGSILDSLNRGKQVIVLPRLSCFGEHVDDHQVELVEALKAQAHIIAETTIAESFALLETFSFMPYHNNQHAIIQKIKAYIEED